MGLFRQLHKSAFWSQLLLGMVAILALPTAEVASERAANPVSQTLNLSELAAYPQLDIEQAHFLQQTQICVHVIQQAVISCEFFANPYRLYAITNPPIRAGPLFS